MHTADNLTDDAIRDLRARLGSETYAGASDDAADCEIALAAPMGSLRRAQARARVAELLNAKHKRHHDRCMSPFDDGHLTCPVVGGR